MFLIQLSFKMRARAFNRERNAERTHAALRWWNEAVSLRGTSAERYLRRRNIYELPPNVDIEAAYQAALLKNVAFSRGAAFFTNPEVKASSMRLNCSRPTTNELIQGLEILGKILAQSV